MTMTTTIPTTITTTMSRAPLDEDDVARLARLIDLEIAPEDLRSVALRLTAIIEGMQQVEAALGARMDTTDPVPPIDLSQWPNRTADGAGASGSGS